MNLLIVPHKSKSKIFRRLFFVAVSFCLVFGLSKSAIAQTLSNAEIKQQAERLRSDNEETRRDALHKLRTSESENASRIATAGLTDKSETVRSTAPFSVLSLPSEEAADNLLPQLKDKSEYVRRETAYALGRTHNLKAGQPLIELLQKDKQFSVKCAVAVALGEIGDPSAINSLIAILQKSPKEDEEFLRRASARSIGQIAEMILQRGFLAQSEIKDFNTYVLQNRKTLSQRFPALRLAVDVLLKTLQNSKEADDPKREATFALGAIGDSRALPVLQANLNDENYFLAQISRESIRKIL